MTEYRILETDDRLFTIQKKFMWTWLDIMATDLHPQNNIGLPGVAVWNTLSSANSWIDKQHELRTSAMFKNFKMVIHRVIR
jgi:hypothetical protein